MSDIAAQLVFHPVVSRSLKLWATTAGRDKTYRLIQYFARFLAYALLSRGNKDEAARFNALKSALGSGRKLMRLFKPLEHLQAALRATQSNAYPIEQYTTIGRQVGYFGYLVLDSAVWAQSIKFIKLDPETAKKVNLTSQRFWISGIVFSIANSVFKIGRLAQQAKSIRQANATEKDVGAEADKIVKLKTLAKERAGVRYQLVQDSLDILLPATSLEFVQINDGVLGLVGAVTSVMALRLQWAKAV